MLLQTVKNNVQKTMGNAVNYGLNSSKLIITCGSDYLLFSTMQTVTNVLNELETDLDEVYDQTGCYLTVLFDLGFYSVTIELKA